MKAWQPWDSPFSDPTPQGPDRKYKEEDRRYAGHNTCKHPECEEWIRDDADTCPFHREWRMALASGNDEESRLERHALFKARLAQGESITHLMYEAKKGRL